LATGSSNRLQFWWNEVAEVTYSGTVFNVGLAEIAVIGVLGLLIFGPEKLPKAVASLVSGIRSLRGMATEASSSLQDAAGLDTAETKKTFADLADLHPKRWAGSVLDPDVSNTGASQSATAQSGHNKTEPARRDTESLDPDLP
jgi:sec-independent protein translocase protein TatB